LTVIVVSRLREAQRRNHRFLQAKALRAFAQIPNTLATVQFSRSAKRRAVPVADQGPRSSERRRRHAGLSKLNSMRPCSYASDDAPARPARSGRHARDRMRSEGGPL
jgi:hypothetical protein